MAHLNNPDTQVAPDYSISSTSAFIHNSPVMFGLGRMGLDLMLPAFAAYFTFYYVDVLGLAVPLAATINTIYAIWDAVNDPLLGYLSDNTRTHWGRRRPWLVGGLPFLLIFLVMGYAVPESFRQGSKLFVYALGATFLFETAATVIFVNYQALFPELFRDLKARARASTLLHGFGMVGELIGLALTPIVYTQFGFVGMAILYAIVGGSLLFMAILRSTEDQSIQETPTVNPFTAFRGVLKDRLFWQVTLVATAGWFTTGIYTLATPFYAKYSLKAAPEAPSYIFGTVFIVAIAVITLWGKVVRRRGIRPTWILALGVMALSTVVLGLAPGMTVAVIGAAVAGAGLGGVKVCREMMLASLVDRSAERSGRRNEGIYYSLNRLLGRLSRVLEALALLLLGLLFGYVSGDNPGPNPEAAFRFLMSVFPFVCLLLAIWLAYLLPKEALETVRATDD
jgi:GPH family glycoside/pentoside/hexuronide:cation symporter